MQTTNKMSHLNLLARVGVIPKCIANAASDRDAPQPPADLADNEVLVYGPIVDEGDRAMLRDIFGVESTSPASFRSALDAVDGDVLVRVNSEGGFVSQGSAIQQVIVENRKRRKVDGIIDGMAYSAASWIALSLDDLQIAQFGEIMFHRAWNGTVGNADAQRAAAQKLDNFDNELVRFVEDSVDYKTLGYESPMALLKGADGNGTFIGSSDAEKAGIARVYNSIESEPPGPDYDDFTANALHAMLKSLNYRRTQCPAQ